MIFCAYNTAFAMLNDNIRVIQTSQVNSWFAFNYFPEIKYKENSKVYSCQYIKKLSTSNEELRSFLEDNKHYTILLVGRSSKRHIDLSLLEFEKRRLRK